MPSLSHFPLFLYTKSSVACAVALVYLCVVRSLRWRRYNAIHKKYSAKFRAKALTPEEAQEILQLSFMYDMPMLAEYSLAFALFKTYGIVCNVRLHCGQSTLTQSAAYYIQASPRYEAAGITSACGQALCRRKS
jgi:hypothetical protein